MDKIKFLKEKKELKRKKGYEIFKILLKVLRENKNMYLKDRIKIRNKLYENHVSMSIKTDYDIVNIISFVILILLNDINTLKLKKDLIEWTEQPPEKIFFKYTHQVLN